MNLPVRRVLVALLALLVLVAVGTVGYYLLGHGQWSIFECVYMTAISISTVGFGELPGMHGVPGARALTVGLIAGGIGTLAYVQANLTALLVEGVIGQAFRRNRMRKTIEALSGHVVVAGAGATGRHVVEELLATRTPFVVIEKNKEHAERLSADLCGGKLLYVLGDATDDQALIEANVKTARGVVAALTHDKDNLFVTLSARSLNASARIVSKVVEDGSAAKMMRAGATSVVSPTQIGGRRMASEIVRPQVTEFLDQMIRDKNQNLRIDEVTIPPGSTMIGVALRDTPIRKETRLLVVAVRGKNSEGYTYNPEPDFVLEAGMTLVVMGDIDSVAKLRDLTAM